MKEKKLTKLNIKTVQNLEKAIKLIPKNNEKLVADLLGTTTSVNVKSAIFAVLKRHFLIPTEDWEFELISAFSKMNIKEIKSIFNVLGSLRSLEESVCLHKKNP